MKQIIECKNNDKVAWDRINDMLADGFELEFEQISKNRCRVELQKEIEIKAI